MKFCQKCGAELVDEAVICPKCGVATGENPIPNVNNTQKKKSVFKKWWFWVIIAVVVIGIGANLDKDDTQSTVNNQTQSNTASTTTSSTASTTTSSAKVDTKKAEIVISAADLAKAYEDNEIKANQDYKNKSAEIKGKISDIGEMLGQTYIILDSEKDFSLTNIQCFFDDKAEISKIASLKKGDTITILGKIDGKSMNVAINNCSIVNKVTAQT